MFKINDEPESPDEGACLTEFLMNPNRQRSVFQIFDEPETPNYGACLRFMMNPNRQMSGRV